MKTCSSLHRTTIFTLGIFAFLLTKCEKEDPVINLNSPYFTITDRAFFNALLELGVDSDKDSLISDAEAEAVEYLYFNESLLQNDKELIEDMTGIEAFVNLVALDCGNIYSTGVTSLSRLDVSKNTKLRDLNCNYGHLRQLNVANNRVLVNLMCACNDIQFMDISNCTDLRIVHCWDNGLWELDISNKRALVELLCDGNRIDSLDISNSTGLSRLSCSYNRLRSLDAANNPDLVTISCAGNELSELDFSQNSNLERLICSENYLTSLKVSNNNALRNLNCGSNQLDNLEVSTIDGLVSLICDYNKLTHLDVSNNPELRYLGCAGNRLVSLDLSKNTKIGIDNNYFYDLDISYMPTLTDVCVWTLPFPPERISVNDWNSPNVRFTEECSSKVENL